MTSLVSGGPDFRTLLSDILPPSGSLLVVAVSGGADSMVLWDLLVRLRRWPLLVWHLDHGLRAEASRDAELIRDQAARYQAFGLVPGRIIVEQAQVAELARQWHLSLEAAGRRHRYARLAEVAHAHGAGAVLTAHHRDDQSETVLANLLRGAGPVGAAGIAPRRPLRHDVVLLRPLLGATRAELRAYASAHGLRWLEDASNQDHRHRRNHLRRVVLPALESQSPGIAAALADLGTRSRTIATELEAVVDAVWPVARDGDALLLAGIVGLEARSRRQVWRRLVMALGISCERRHLERIDQLATGIPGRRLHLGRWLLLRRAQTLAWEPARPPRNQRYVEIPGPGSYHSAGECMTCRVQPRPPAPIFAPEQAWLDAASCTWPLVWRAAGRDERFTPLGAPGRQTLVKFLSTRGVPSRQRPEMSVVADAQGIVWVPRFGIAERVKLTGTTRDVVHLQWAATCGTDTAPTVATLQESTDERS